MEDSRIHRTLQNDHVPEIYLFHHLKFIALINKQYLKHLIFKTITSPSCPEHTYGLRPGGRLWAGTNPLEAGSEAPSNKAEPGFQRQRPGDL